MKPVIGIVPSFIKNTKEEYYKLFQNYCNCVIDKGGLPIIIPIIGNIDIKEILNSIDGLLLSGGPDIEPSYYKEKILVKNLVISEQRDKFEICIVRQALQKDIPILGICRGMQILNVAAGGKLYQDIKEYTPSRINHRVIGEKEKWGTHEVKLVKNMILHNIFQKQYLIVNSIHHQAVAKLAEGFFANAFSEDGIIEGIENLNYSLALGIQWHPERMVEIYPEQYNLFELLVKKAMENLKYKEKNK